MACVAVTLHGMYSGPKAESDALLEASGLLGVSGVQYIYYLEQPYIDTMLYFGWRTIGAIADPVCAQRLTID